MHVGKQAGFQHFWALCGILSAFGGHCAHAQGLIAYRGATLETMAEAGRIERGVVLVRDGLIDAVGADVAIPDTAKVIDVSGQVIMPALVDAYHPIDLGVVPEPEARTVTIRGRTFTIPSRGGRATGGFVRVADNVDPLKLKNDLQRLARLGIGRTNLVTGGYGQAALARTATEDMNQVLTSGDGYLYLPLSNNSINLGQLRSGLSGGRSGPVPVGRGGRGRGSLGGRGRRGGGPPVGASAGGPPQRASEPSAATQLWNKVREGQTRLIVNANNAAAILHLLKELKDYEKVSVVLVASGEHLYQTLDALKERPHLSVIMPPDIDYVPFSRDRVNVPRMLTDAKIDYGFCLSLRDDLSQLTDSPFFPVSLLVKSGLPRETALRALTRQPARILDLDKSLGTLETGKSADLLFFDGDPLDPSSRIVRVVVEGSTVHEG